MEGRVGEEGRGREKEGKGGKRGLEERGKELVETGREGGGDSKELEDTRKVSG